LTAPIRGHLTYLRAKSFTDYLPQAISNMPGERVELDDVVTYITKPQVFVAGQDNGTKHPKPSAKEV
jgi:hypothetical protein